MHTCHNIVQKQRQCIVGAQETHSQSTRKRRIRRIFTPTFGFVREHFPAGDSNLRQFFFC